MSPGGPSLRELLDQLAGEGLWNPALEGRAEVLLADYLLREAPQPWYLRLLAAAGAWGIAASGLGLLALLLPLDSGAGRLIAGALLIAAGTGLRWRIRHRPPTALAQLALAGLIAGDVLGITAAAELLDGRTWALLGAGLNALLLAIYPDRLGRFLGALSACLLAAWWVGGQPLELPPHTLGAALLPAAIALAGAEPDRSPLAVRGPAAAGMIGAMFCLLILDLWVRREPGPWAWLSAASLCAGAIGLAARIARATGLRGPRAAWIYLGPVGLGLLTWRVPGVLAAAAVMALGFHRREPVLTGAAAVFLAGFLGFLYYDLDLSLPAKSLALLGGGGLLLVARQLLLRGPAGAAEGP